jgi:hypothetical protein
VLSGNCVTQLETCRSFFLDKKKEKFSGTLTGFTDCHTRELRRMQVSLEPRVEPRSLLSMAVVVLQ